MLQYWRVYLMVLAALGFGATRLWGTFSNEGYAPEQPIPFSHLLHAGALKINCLYCHTSAEKSAHATVPPLQTCMGCHSVVKTDSPHIQKLTKAYNEGESIEWVRIHKLPDHSHFSHRWHIAAGIECQTCHGPIETMAKVAQFQKLEMKACMDCHRQSDYVKNIDHPGSYQEGFAKTLTTQQIESMKQDPGWSSMKERTAAKTASSRAPGEAVDDAVVALNMLYEKDIYYHGRGYQLRNKNAAVECTTCHH